MTMFIKQQITSLINQISTVHFIFPDMKYMFLFSLLWSGKNRTKCDLLWSEHSLIYNSSWCQLHLSFGLIHKADSPLNSWNKDPKICSRFICVYNLSSLARSMSLGSKIKSTADSLVENVHTNNLYLVDTYFKKNQKETWCKTRTKKVIWIRQFSAKRQENLTIKI